MALYKIEKFSQKLPLRNFLFLFDKKLVHEFKIISSYDSLKTFHFWFYVKVSSIFEKKNKMMVQKKLTIVKFYFFFNLVSLLRPWKNLFRRFKILSEENIECPIASIFYNLIYIDLKLIFYSIAIKTGTAIWRSALKFVFWFIMFRSQGIVYHSAAFLFLSYVIWFLSNKTTHCCPHLTVLSKTLNSISLI